MIFLVAKHSNAAIAEMVSVCPSWQCFAAPGTGMCQISVEHSPTLKGTGAPCIPQRLDPALDALLHLPEPGEVTSATSAVM